MYFKVFNIEIETFQGFTFQCQNSNKIIFIIIGKSIAKIGKFDQLPETNILK